MNEVRLSGKVTKAYIKDDGTFIMRLACKYDHKIGAETIRCESSFPVIMSDTAKTKHLDVIAGDKVLVTGYLRVDFRLSKTGQERQKLNIYASEIEVTKEAWNQGI
ncbi:MAG: hypothetical protein L6V86_08740 [Treponema sp.]|nr:MAG: hypothetical protein L6V86_08740 [Treponema sp.]